MRAKDVLLIVVTAAITAVVTNIVNHYFPPEAMPAALRFLAVSVPAWALVIAGGLGYFIRWNLDKGGRRNVETTLALQQFEPDVAEQIILERFGRARGEGTAKQLAEVLPKLAGEHELTVLELEHAIDSLRREEWLEESYIPPNHALKYRLSPEAARYCRSRKWLRAAAPPAVKSDP